MGTVEQRGSANLASANETLLHHRTWTNVRCEAVAERIVAGVGVECETARGWCMGATHRSRHSCNYWVLVRRRRGCGRADVRAWCCVVPRRPRYCGSELGNNTGQHGVVPGECATAESPGQRAHEQEMGALCGKACHPGASGLVLGASHGGVVGALEPRVGVARDCGPGGYQAALVEFWRLGTTGDPDFDSRPGRMM